MFREGGGASCELEDSESELDEPDSEPLEELLEFDDESDVEPELDSVDVVDFFRDDIFPLCRSFTQNTIYTITLKQRNMVDAALKH